MIFVTVGTQKFKFDRLLRIVDEFIENGVICEKVFAQIGTCSYIPKNYEYVKFLSPEEYDKCLKDCSYVIAHAGVGSIHSALKLNKKILVVPRISKYNEHIDDHQCEIARKYGELGLCVVANGEDDFKLALDAIPKFISKRFSFIDSNDSKILIDIDKYLNGGREKMKKNVK